MAASNDVNKATIKPLEGKNKEEIKVLFNPNEYTIETSNQLSSVMITGLSEPVSQFISGNAQTLSMELFFDTTEKGEDVRNYSGKVVNLAKVDSELHAPPLVEFMWGAGADGGFKGILEKVSQRFTMFNSQGVPIRAVLNVTFRSRKSVQEQLTEISRHSADRTKQKMLNQGEQLWMLAAEEYEDPEKWKEIAKANNIDNPRVLEHGKMICIPRLE